MSHMKKFLPSFMCESQRKKLGLELAKNHKSRKQSLLKESQVCTSTRLSSFDNFAISNFTQSDLGNLHHSLQNDQGDKDKSHENHPQKNISAIIVWTHATSLFI